MTVSKSNSFFVCTFFNWTPSEHGQTSRTCLPLIFWHVQHESWRQGRHRAAQSINCGQCPHCAINVSPLHCDAMSRVPRAQSRHVPRTTRAHVFKPSLNERGCCRSWPRQPYLGHPNISQRGWWRLLGHWLPCPTNTLIFLWRHNIWCLVLIIIQNVNDFKAVFNVSQSGQSK